MIDDFQTDTSLQMVARVLSKEGQIPEFVKTASLDEFEQYQGRDGFALPHKRRLPCHTKVACYLSHLYFGLQQDRLPEYERKLAESRLAYFADLHEIRDEVQRVPALLRQEKPIEVGEVAAKVASNADRLPLADLIRFAREVKASGVKVAAGDYLSAWAFDDHFVDLPRSIASLTANYGHTRLFETLWNPHSKTASSAEALDSPTPRQLHAAVPEIFESLEETLSNLSRDALRSKIAGFPVYPEHVVKIATGQVYGESQLIPKLAKLDRLLGIELVEGPLNRPKNGWQDALEALSIDQARDVRDFMKD